MSRWLLIAGFICILAKYFDARDLRSVVLVQKMRQGCNAIRKETLNRNGTMKDSIIFEHFNKMNQKIENLQELIFKLYNLIENKFLKQNHLILPINMCENSTESFNNESLNLTNYNSNLNLQIKKLKEELRSLTNKKKGTFQI